MTTQRKSPAAALEAALSYLRLGYRPIPVIAGTKRAAIKWKELQGAAVSEQDVRELFAAEASNVALLCGNGLAVVDVDDPRILDFVIRNCGDSPMRCRTPSDGLHLYYAMPPGARCSSGVRIYGKAIDLRCAGAYAVCPPSYDDRGTGYRWLTEVVSPPQLPYLDISWLRQREPKRLVLPAIHTGSSITAVRRARGYLATVEGAISGQRGHDRTFRVACVLAIKFGLSFEQAWPLLLEWNTQCEPPWSDKELEHKLIDALKLRKPTQSQSLISFPPLSS